LQKLNGFIEGWNYDDKLIDEVT